MSIVLNCPECNAVLRLADAMAGKRGACRKCGGEIRVPKDADPYRPLEERPLGKATMDDIVNELARRGQTAILTVLGADKSSRANGAAESTIVGRAGDSQMNVGVKHYTTEAMPDSRLEQLFGGLAKLASQRREALKGSSQPAGVSKQPTPPGPAAQPVVPSSAELSLESLPDVGTEVPTQEEPTDAASGSDFDFKGDVLGMSLAEFKLKHERSVEGRRRRLPWCSDETPGVANPELLSEAWHVEAGIIHARIDVPFENRSPTIGGVATEMVIYQFVDNKLFQITGFFSTEGFHTISDAVRKKFGIPQSENHQPRQMHWWKLNSSLELTSGRLHPREPGVIRYYHDELLAEASKRKPERSSDL